MATVNPLVSVIIPTYKRGSLIKATIESVIQQTYPNYELIIVDDASGDNTADWIAEHYPQFQLIRLSQNLGNGGARNVGLQPAKGELIAFLDHDDQWLPEYLETQVKVLQSNPNAVLSYCDYFEVREDSSQILHDLKPKSIYSDFTYYLLRWNIIDSLSITLIRNKFLLSAGQFDESLKICNDMDLYLRLSQYGQIIHIPQPLAFKYRHRGNLCNNYWLWAKDELALLNSFFAKDISKPYAHLQSEIKSYALLKILRLTWPFHHDFWFALVMLCKSFILAPRYRIRLVLARLSKKFFHS